MVWERVVPFLRFWCFWFVAVKDKEGQMGVCGCREEERQSAKGNVREKLGRRGQKKKRERNLWKEEEGNQRNYSKIGRKRWKTGKNWRTRNTQGEVNNELSWGIAMVKEEIQTYFCGVFKPSCTCISGLSFSCYRQKYWALRLVKVWV